MEKHIAITKKNNMAQHSFHFLVDQLTRIDLPEGLDLQSPCRFHLRRTRFPFCVLNYSTTVAQPACFLPGATVAVLTVLQRFDSLHIITSNTRHGLCRVHQYPLITPPLTRSLRRRIPCIPAYFPLNSVLLSASSASLCAALQSVPHYSSALPSLESRELQHQLLPSACITFSWHSATYPPPAGPPACPLPPSVPLSLVIPEQSLVLFSLSVQPCSGIQIKKEKKKRKTLA